MNFIRFAWRLLRDQRGEIGDLPPDDNPPTDTPADDATPPATPAQPQFVPSEEFKQFQTLMTTGFERLGQSVQALLDAQNRPPPAPSITDVTDEEINNAITSGENPAKVLRRLNAAAEARMRRELEARSGQIEEVGYGSLAALASEVATNKMDKKLAARYKKEIDGYVNTLAPALRTRPDTYLVAYNAVIGMHMTEIVSEEREAAIRQSRQQPPAPTPGTSNARGTGSATVPTVEDLYGKEASDRMREQGLSPDDFARKWGYKNWEDRVKQLHAEELQ